MKLIGAETDVFMGLDVELEILGIESMSTRSGGLGHLTTVYYNRKALDNLKKSFEKDFYGTAFGSE